MKKEDKEIMIMEKKFTIYTNEVLKCGAEIVEYVMRRNLGKIENFRSF